MPDPMIRPGTLVSDRQINPDPLESKHAAMAERVALTVLVPKIGPKTMARGGESSVCPVLRAMVLTAFGASSVGTKVRL